MMHDVMMIHKKKKNKQDLIGVIPGAVTNDTTNTGSRPEIPRTGTEEERWNNRIFGRRVDLLDTSDTSCCST
jgi:hypothetical protein